MAIKKSILFFSYYFDPKMLTATRNFYLANELANIGYTVYIVGRISSSAQKSLLPNQHFYQVDSWDYRKLLEKLGAKDGVTNDLIKMPKLMNKLYKIFLNYPFNKYLAEGGGFYLSKAIEIGSKIIKEHTIDFIYSSYRPLADHFIAQSIKRKFPHTKWIGDFRDVLWWKKSSTHYQEKWIRSLINDMDFPVAITKGIATFWTQAVGKEFKVMYNGLPLAVKKQYDNKNSKFEINYTGRIYLDFQEADILFLALKELMTANKRFAEDIQLRYSGFQYLKWNEWMENHKLAKVCISNFQVDQNTAHEYQARAAINLLLTWCNEEIQGFIHGKYNEYVLARNPILCIVQGKMDEELKTLYDDLGNSLIVCNELFEKEKIKEFILMNYFQWKAGNIKVIPDDALKFYEWGTVMRPLLNYLEQN